MINKLKDKKKEKKDPQKLRDILDSKEWIEQRYRSQKYITKEYQVFGLSLAERLDDKVHRSLYIKLAKTEDRGILENALSFASDYPKAGNKAKLFMWKLKELRKEYKNKF